MLAKVMGKSQIKTCASDHGASPPCMLAKVLGKSQIQTYASNACNVMS